MPCLDLVVQSFLTLTFLTQNEYLFMRSFVVHLPLGRHAACVLRPSPSVLDLLWPRGRPSTRFRTAPNKTRRSSWVEWDRSDPV